MDTDVIASCHCGSVRLEVDSPPSEVTECNCSICRRYGVLWAYYPPHQVRMLPPRSAHRRLHVGWQVHRVPPLPELRLCLVLGRRRPQPQPDGRQRAPHAPGDPGRRPRTPPRWRRHQSVHRLTIGGYANDRVTRSRRAARSAARYEVTPIGPRLAIPKCLRRLSWPKTEILRVAMCLAVGACDAAEREGRATMDGP